MLRSPYYYTTRQIDADCVVGPTSNYDSYNLYCLKTRLTSILGEHFFPGLSYNIIPTLENNRMVLYLQLVHGNELVNLNNKDLALAQRHVDMITTNLSDRCLIFQATNISFDDGFVISRDLVANSLPYIKFNPQFYVTIEGSKVYANLRQFNVHEVIAQQIEDDIIYNIKEIVAQGYVINPPEFIIEAWNLQKISNNDPEDDYNHLYKPRWKEPRLLLNQNKLTPFIMARYENNYSLQLSYPLKLYNLVARHYLVNYINQYFSNITKISFYDDIVQLNLDDNIGFTYNIAMQLLTLIEQSGFFSTGQIIIFNNKSRGVAEKYQELMKEYTTEIVHYQVDDNSYIVSGLFNLHSNTGMIEDILYRKLYQSICQPQLA